MVHLGAQGTVHTVVYAQDGDSWCEDQRLVDARPDERKTDIDRWVDA